MKFEFNWPSGFRGEDVYFCYFISRFHEIYIYIKKIAFSEYGLMRSLIYVLLGAYYYVY